ncbi:MAG: iron-containing redox enzyme family protein [Acidobacteria bacterium]|nr:iron-containing redox enzyme family protein [Acidobacteriota bacterium]MBV9478957.1 iron-containing redox enzyme family protein [Acidobacteriota bacterium]
MNHDARTHDVYITALGKFLPGPPIGNDEMEDYLGLIHGKPSRLRHRILRQNGILQRHYAIDRNQRSLYRNSEMAAAAVRDALQRGTFEAESLQMIAAATTAPDLLAPGFASMIHGELASSRCEVASLQGICASGMMAMKSVFSQIRSGEKANGVACASEFASRRLKASAYEGEACVRSGKPLPFSAEFLRWMLSDGAGAALLRDRPNRRGVSLRIDWIELWSYAHRRPVCMWIGGAGDDVARQNVSWQDYRAVDDAVSDGAFILQQDVRLLDDVVKVCIDGFLELVEQRRVDPASIDWMVCHYSSHIFRDKIFELLRRAGAMVPEERWFSNLERRGNVGSASPYLLLEELLNERALVPGQKILCVVPESGRFIASYMMMTVVGEGAAVAPAKPAIELESATPALSSSHDAKPHLESLVRQLTRVWIDFEERLQAIPIVRRIESGELTADAYRTLLLQLRQQVVDGSRWIARAASNVSADFFPQRAAFLRHAVAEHRDFLMLEDDFVAMGGSLDEIRAGEKNVGSEALSAFMFQRAGQQNPFDLLGAMFIIEGLGAHKAGRWAHAIKQALGLTDRGVSFLAHHGTADDDHMRGLELLLESGIVTPELASQIVKTARVTARLYRLQLEEISC